jgi:hypothetical protein
MLYKNEFPDFVLDVEIPAGFIDNSWHNNAMPCWYRELADNQVVVLWIDYADTALRDHPLNARFVVHLMDNTLTDVSESFVTDDYKEILQQLTDYFPCIQLTNDELQERRSELWRDIPEGDHARNWEHLDELKDIDDELSERGIE